MADVGGDERAQLLLVTALALAVLFVSLALLLNTAIYTENLATRDAVGSARGAASFQSATRESVASLVTYANYHENSSTPTLWRELSDSIANYSEAQTTHRMARGRLANVSLRATHNGTRIGQDGVRRFTDTEGNHTWTVADDVSRSRAVRLRVRVNGTSPATNGTVAPADLESSGVFRVNVTEGTDDYRVFVYRDAGDLAVTVNRTGDVSTCRYAPAAADENVTVDLSLGTVAGRPCKRLGFLPGLAGGSYRVDFRHGENATGSYGLVINESSPEADRSYTGGTGPPYTTDAIYDAVVGVTYDSRDVHYAARFRVAPGEDRD